MVVVIGGILLLRLHAFLALLLAALFVAILTPRDSIEQYALARGHDLETARAQSEQSVGERVAGGFGRTAGQVGIVIAMASIIGVCMLESGAADRLVRSALRFLGEKRAAFAFAGSGFFLAIPVFFDTVFYLMIPLAKATRMRTGRNYLLYILCVVAGGTMAHSLVPPTPGPLFVAGEFGVDIGLMIIGGCLVGLPASTAGCIYAHWANRKWPTPLRESEDSLRQLEEIAELEEERLPRTWISIAPVVLPVFLIAGQTVLPSLDSIDSDGFLYRAGSFLGDKNIALTLAAALAMLLMLSKTSASQTIRAVKTGLTTAGIIILIIGAGGAFGTALQQTGIGSTIKELSSMYQVSLIPLAFLLTAMIRTAQGSATVAMITAAGAFSGLAEASQLGFHPLYIALAIGCGSKPIWWMNDSGFWVVSQMSGMTEKEGLRTLTPLALIMGVVGLIVTMLGAYFLPLI
jgi:GntP family gluconate:H+ symporter